ncbi:hypothetical protein BMF94_1827 [Rhodotorula taiwanensis]|uniref:4'-phosphopantetheinyl transferase domain-containing protein n=1 Tax=Rhodotorula taiwanensis TaxID=741276 RepID=A0A2S5BEJ3_9BASI|nr:hypothetical protein BMF94_1827 [Rhodotorula taiwanensis]
MLLGVGVDLLSLARLRSVLSRRNPARLAARILSDVEVKEWHALSTKAERSEQFLALRWAAKEAAYKALYPAVIPRWADLTVSKQGPKPVLSFSNSPRFPRPSEPDFDRIRMHLSVSHDADLLIAYVVAEVRETQVSNA